MPDKDLSELMRVTVDSILKTLSASASCCKLNLPANQSGLAAVVQPFPGDEEFPIKMVAMKVLVHHDTNDGARQAIELVYSTLHNYEFPSPTAYNDYKIVCTAVSAPTYEGESETAKQFFSCTFSLTTLSS